MSLFLAGRATAAVAATQCGLEMLEAREGLSDYAMEHFSFELRMGIGIDSGRALVGHVGYYNNTHLTAIGDVVNMASRVQELTKETDANLLITKAVRDRLADGFRIGSEVDREIRGKEGQYPVFEVLGTR